MSAETWIGIAIIGYVAMIFVVIGVVQLRSEKPVGFWTGEKPPAPSDITDVRAYNRAHGWMWIGYAIAMVLSYVIGMLTGDGVWMSILFGSVTIGGIGVLVWIHHRLYRKYVREL